MIPTARTGRAGVLAVLLAVPVSAHEGIKLTPYYDPIGVKTVCMGHTDGVEDRRYTYGECKALLTKELTQACTQVEKAFPKAPDRVLLSVCDMVYNIGPKVINPQSSTMARYIIAERYDEACDQMLKWDKGRVFGIMQSLPGLTARRKWDREVCLNGLKKK